MQVLKKTPNGMVIIRLMIIKQKLEQTGIV